MLLTGERDGWVGELRERLRSGLDAQESTLSGCAAAGTTGGSGDAAVTVVMGGEEGADLEVLPNTFRTDSTGSGSRPTKLVRGMEELSLLASGSIADLLSCGDEGSKS